MAEHEGSYRYERKFLVDGPGVEQVRTLVRLHPCLFKQTYPPRHVNNIYLDTVGLENYRDNLSGASERRKVRVRWYGELLGRIDRPVLEFKIRRGAVGSKECYPLAPFVLDGSFGDRTLQEVFDQSALPAPVRAYLADLRAVLLNRYYRWYYATAGGRYRTTVDAHLQFYHPRWLRSGFQHGYVDHDHVVLEIKYQDSNDPQAGRVVGFFPFTLSRNSKYVQGIEAVHLL